MVILAVDDNRSRLARTAKMLSEIFPKETVLAEGDSLMAGKYVFNNPVDIVCAAWDMKRMDGPQMAVFARKAHPDVRVLLTSCPGGRAGGIPRSGEADALLSEPLTPDELRAALNRLFLPPHSEQETMHMSEK